MYYVGLRLVAILPGGDGGDGGGGGGGGGGGNSSSSSSCCCIEKGWSTASELQGPSYGL